MWNFADDMAKWDQIALEAHARHSRTSNSAYVRSQSVVEGAAHRHVAEAARGAKRVLELGVGGGEHLAFAPHLDKHELYVGLDLSFEFASICRDKFGIPVTTADIAALPFASSSFDCVIAMNLLEHVQQLDKALEEVARVLVPGGSFHVVVPTNGGLAVNLFKLAMTYPTMRSRGIRRPDLVWHYLNVNPFKRVHALLNSHFSVTQERAIPVAVMPWFMSPLWAFHCVRK